MLLLDEGVKDIANGFGTLLGISLLPTFVVYIGHSKPVANDVSMHSERANSFGGYVHTSSRTLLPILRFMLVDGFIMRWA